LEVKKLAGETLFVFTYLPIEPIPAIMSGLSSKPDPKSGSGMSSVGNRGVYEADDQRTVPDSEKNKAARFQKSKEHSHQPNDSSAYTVAGVFLNTRDQPKW
jgi:hypothetical protein